MVHTLPDYTTKYRMANTFGNLDDAELAARLGAASLLDRRGNYVWHDAFEASILKWAIHAAGGVGDVSLNGSTAYTGSQSLKLKTDAVDNSNSYIIKRFPVPQNSSIGNEITIKMENSPGFFEIALIGYNGTTKIVAAIKLILDSKNLQYYGSDLNWHNFAAAAVPDFDDESWLTMKLVFDWDTVKYVRAIVGGVSYDLSAYTPENAPNGTKPFISVQLLLWSDENVSRTGYVDSFILTQNEP